MTAQTCTCCGHPTHDHPCPPHDPNRERQAPNHHTLPMQPKGTTMNSLDDILTEWADITARLDALTARKEQLTAQLRDLGEGTHTGDTGKVTVSPPTRRFDAKRAVETLTPELVALCQETTISSAKAKQMLPPALYEQCQSVTGSAKPRVTVKLA